MKGEPGSANRPADQRGAAPPRLRQNHPRSEQKMRLFMTVALAAGNRNRMCPFIGLAAALRIEPEKPFCLSVSL